MSDETGIVASRFHVRNTRLEVTGTPSLEEWLLEGEKLWALKNAVQWAIGDWLIYGEWAYGEKYAQAMDATEYDYQALADLRWVAQSVKTSLRNENLSFSHHRAVAPLPPDEQRYWLDHAESEGLSYRELRAAIKSQSPTLPKSTDDYETLYEGKVTIAAYEVNRFVTFETPGLGIRPGDVLYVTIKRKAK